MKASTAKWIAEQLLRLGSIRAFDAWNAERMAKWRRQNPRKRRAQVLRQKDYSRSRRARLRGLIVWEIMRRIKVATHVNPMVQKL